MGVLCSTYRPLHIWVVQYHVKLCQAVHVEQQRLVRHTKPATRNSTITIFVIATVSGGSGEGGEAVHEGINLTLAGVHVYLLVCVCGVVLRVRRCVVSV